MSYAVDITIKFIDGEKIKLSCVDRYGIEKGKFVYVDQGNYRQFFNFSTIKYIGRSLDLKQEE